MPLTPWFMVEMKGSKDLATSSNLWKWKLANIVALVAGLALVAIPGRLDGPDMQESRKEDALNYLTPAGYAFAIWGVIYSMEVVFVFWQAFQFPGTASEERLAMIVGASPGFIGANMFGCAWSLAFRPWANSFALMWIPALLLVGMAVSLSFAHRALASARGVDWVVMLFPISLHFGWSTAASLVNLNDWFSLSSSVSPSQQAAFAGLSVALAGFVGASVTWQRGTGLYAGTLAWALIAVGVGSLQSERLEAEIGASSTTVMGVVELILGAGLLLLGVGIGVKSALAAK